MALPILDPIHRTSSNHAIAHGKLKKVSCCGNPGVDRAGGYVAIFGDPALAIALADFGQQARGILRPIRKQKSDSMPVIVNRALGSGQYFEEVR